MAKDTEKLIRQLSLISYLMAERRPVTALEIRRDVEGYSTMNEDAFARRFYADRSELDSLGIVLTVERPVDGVARPHDVNRTVHTNAGHQHRLKPPAGHKNSSIAQRAKRRLAGLLRQLG